MGVADESWVDPSTIQMSQAPYEEVVTSSDIANGKDTAVRILFFNEDEWQKILSLYHLATNEEARITQNATVQRAEAVLLQLFGEKVVEATHV